MTWKLDIRELARDELDKVSGGPSGPAMSTGDSSLDVSSLDTFAARTITMFLRRVWRAGV